MMAVFILALLLAVGVSADHLPVQTNGRISSDISDEVDSECAFPFQAVGNNCYHFSEEQKSFEDAMHYCHSLEPGHTYEVSLAMLDYDETEDQALFDVIATKETTYWFGGKSEDGINWNWLDDRTINLNAPFWYCGEPINDQKNCAAVELDTKRPYLYGHACTESLNFICQTGLHVDFRRIGNYYYFMSEEAGVPHASWQNARDYCQSLVVPVGYHADLAVLGLPDQDSYYLLENLIAGNAYSHTWVGALAQSDCQYNWIDGRELPVSSLYWRYSQPACGASTHVNLFHSGCNDNKALVDNAESNHFPFICQMFKGAK